MQLPIIALYERGYTPLVSVIPPNATLSPLSKIAAHQLGKVPGRRNANGTWGGYAWQQHQPTLEEVREWALAGANVGILATHFPGVDIDCMEPRLSSIIESVAVATLGAAPIRTGRAPKRLLMYRAAVPFARMRAWVEDVAASTTHLIEILGEGQQYLISGVHPGTGQPYGWDTDLLELPPAELTEITRADAETFFDELERSLLPLGYRFTRDQSATRGGRAHAPSQLGLVAPSIEALRECVAAIPNTDAQFPSRDDYVKVGYAIRAAGGEQLDEAFAIFSDWAARWEGGFNDPERVLGDWRRMHPPYSVGWDWLSRLAQANGFEAAQHDFTADLPSPEREDRAPHDESPDPLWGTEQWLAREIVTRYGSQLRYVPARRIWLVWDGVRWVPDALNLAENRVNAALIEIADEVARRGVSDEDKAKSVKQAAAFLTQQRSQNVLSLMKSDTRIAVAPQSLDADGWMLNTPSGIVNLRTGQVLASDPEALCTKVTGAGPAAGVACPRWMGFVHEACGGDAEAVAYLQRLCGYALTGSTREQQLTFIWGPGRNGKSVFVEALSGVLGDYAATAPMDTFTASQNERHSTEIAMLAGARLVVSSETQAGRRWDEARIKSLTGGERVTARFMRQNNFTFLPQFKLVFVGNHKPEVRDLDLAMRRRVQLLPFIAKPREIDGELGAKLREEYPAILAWMIEGALEWQRVGLCPPVVVQAATQEYFEEQDAVGSFLAECTVEVPGALLPAADLFERWREWAHERNEHVGSLKRLSQAVASKGIRKDREPKTRRASFTGIALTPQILRAGL